ncbi:adenosylcobinamide-phosphate synthase CbiB [Meiothermus cerbereus]|uniref:adenosylcobinamide-phosphate synthase CbiB n=1 Tax=Meiothermus cerbereus TaxID=65552 RepID=UPI003F509AD6
MKLLFTALSLKPLFAFRMLLDEVNAVEKLLEESLEAARTRLSHLVSRPAEALSPNEVRESALESLAENLNDSLVAPLFWFVLLGLSGAALYRFANTADALWGYRGSWEWAGKFAACADDCLSYIPARITGLLLCGWRCPWKALWREARKTPSPNSGWPMAALALFLGIRLSKPNVYVLHSSGRLPTAQDLQAGLSRAIWVGWSAGLVAGLCTWNSGQAILGLF